MSSSSLRRKKPLRQPCRHRRLRAEALEGRMMLTSVAALPFSVALLNQPSSSALPPDPVINLQPIVSAATMGAPIQWQGHFSERLQESPLASGTSAAPAAWLVDVIYSLNEQPVAAPATAAVAKGGLVAASPSNSFTVTGTARETLTPLNAAGNPVASGQVWVSNDTISSRIVVTPSPQMNPVANNFAFTTDTSIKQVMTPLVAMAGAAMTFPSWLANTTTHTTGTIIEAASLTSGTLSFQEQINQTLSPLTSSSLIVAGGWTINAEFDGGGTFQNAPTTTGATSSMTLAIAGTLTGTLSPPGSGPTQLLGSKVAANVVFLPT